jgi:hypothetical protein
VLLLASELCANAVVHTRSGQAGGQFTVDVEWSSQLARVVVGDQGSLETPVAGTRSTGAAWSEESGRGLWLVDAMADDWGTASARAGRWVWFSVDWQARGGPPLAAPEGTGTAITTSTEIRAAFPGTTAWWGHQTRTWQAALPEAAGGSLVSASTPVRLRQAVARAYPRLARPAWPRGQRRGPEAGVAGTAGATPDLPATPQQAPARLATALENAQGRSPQMITAQCACGFAELDDETLLDHLQLAFEPADHTGNDGQVHEEAGPLSCLCGFMAITGEDFDQHLLSVFTPADAVGQDGHKHAPARDHSEG